MNLVIDTNILISALIKNSITRKIIFESGWTFYYPSISLVEIDKYKDLILEKSGLSREEYSLLLDSLKNYILFIDFPIYEIYMSEAETIMKHIDEKDVVFVATALSTKNQGIWTTDTDFDKQTKLKVWKTVDVLNKFEADRVQGNNSSLTK